MKTKTKTTIICLLLCVCLIIAATLTACKDKQLNWEFKEGETFLNLGMEVVKGDQQSSIVVTSKEDVFSSVNKDQIKLFAVTFSETEELGAVQENIEITNFSVNFDNARQITITVPKGDKEYFGFNVAIHPSATNSGKPAEASSLNALNTKDIVTCKATIDEEFTVGDVNPVIEVKLTNTALSDDFNNDMIRLTGAFSNLSITSVSGTDVITVTTTGTVSFSAPLLASVDFAGEATTSGTSLSAMSKINYRLAYIKQDSFVFANNKLTFDVELNSDEFKFAVNDSFSSSGATYTVKAISEDKKVITLSVASAAANLDAAIDVLLNKETMTFPKEKLLSNAALTVNFYATKATFGASIDYIEKDEENANTYIATIYIYPISGEMDTLAASNLTFGGDFKNANITSVVKGNEIHQVVFTFTKEGVNLEDAIFSGTLTLAAGKVKNAWGTTREELVSEISYTTNMDRGETLDAIKGFVDANKDTFETIGTVGGAVGGVASGINGVITILGMCGVVETTDSKLDAIRSQIVSVQESLDTIDGKITSLARSLSNDLSLILIKEDKNLHANSKANYFSFLKSYVVPLKDILKNYKNAYETYLLQYINASGTSDSIKVYVDSNGKVALPHPSQDGYSFDGLNLQSSKSYRLATPLKDAKGTATISSKVVAEGGLYDGYWEDITGTSATATINLLDLDDGNKPATLNRIEYFKAVQVQAALSALNTVGKTNILNAYKNFCYALGGSVGGMPKAAAATTPLDDFHQMVSSYYNFYPEAIGDIEATRSWFYGFLAETSGLAAFANSYVSTKKSDLEIIPKAYKIAKLELDNNTGEHRTKDGKIDTLYCYVVGKTLSVEKIEDWHKPHAFATIELRDSDRKPYNFSSILSTNNIKSMMGRYETMYKAGLTTAPTFSHYLVQVGLLTDENLIYPYEVSFSSWLLKIFNKKPHPTYVKRHNTITVITTPPELRALPKDNSSSLPICWAIDTAEWLKVGDKLSVGTNGKFSSKYFVESIMLLADTITLDGVVTPSHRIAASATYDEWHFYWIPNFSETYKAFDHIDNAIIIKCS